MIRRFARSEHKVRKGTRQPAALVAYAPAHCRFNTEARELVAEVCARRHLLTQRPDAWQAWPDEEAGVLYLVPDSEGSDNFPFQWSPSGDRAWVNFYELFDALDLNLLPDRPEKFPVSAEEHPVLGWCLAVHLGRRTAARREDLEEEPDPCAGEAAPDRQVAAGEDAGG